MMIRKLIYKLGVLIINKKVFEHYKFLMNSQHWDREELQKYQYRKLKEILHYAYNNSEYYRNKYIQNNFHPDQISSLDDLRKIPVITKQEVLNNPKKIQVRDFPEKLVYSKTSGTTGRPFVFYRNKDWDAWHRASVLRGYSWYGVNPWERNGYFWGYNFSFKESLKIKLLDCLQNQFRIFSFNRSDIDSFIKKLKKASYLEGYSSLIYEIAKRVNNGSYKKAEFNLKMIKGTSESILDIYQDVVEEAFGRKMISEYGSAEAGIIAFECPQGSLHMNMETVIVEEEDNEIIVTNLVARAFPIIRYKLGDYITVDKNLKCKCGMRHFIIKEVVGRVGKVVYGYAHEYPSFTINYIFRNLAATRKLLLNYEVIQESKGALLVHIEQHLNNAEQVLLLKEFKRYFAEDMSTTIIDGVTLSSLGRKKTGFISKI